MNLSAIIFGAVLMMLSLVFIVFPERIGRIIRKLYPEDGLFGWFGKIYSSKIYITLMGAVLWISGLIFLLAVGFKAWR